MGKAGAAPRAALAPQVGLTVPGRPYVGRFYAGPAGTLVPTYASGRADRPRSAAGMGPGFSMRSMMVPDPLPVTAFNTRSGTPSLREAKPLVTAGRLARGHVGKGRNNSEYRVEVRVTNR